jgi:hypothetical protein
VDGESNYRDIFLATYPINCIHRRGSHFREVFMSGKTTRIVQTAKQVAKVIGNPVNLSICAALLFTAVAFHDTDVIAEKMRKDISNMEAKHNGKPKTPEQPQRQSYKLNIEP